MRKGLHIDDDEEERQVDHYQTLDANRKKGKFEKNLDNLLFGAPLTKKQPISTADTELKNREQSKPIGKTIVQPKTTPQSGKPVTPVKPIDQTKVNIVVNGSSAKSVTDSSITKSIFKNDSIKQPQPVNQFQATVSIIGTQKPRQSNVQSTQMTKESQFALKFEKTNPNPNSKQSIVQIKVQDSHIAETTKQIQFNIQPPPPQPIRYQELNFKDIVHPDPIKMTFNRPAYIRKLKKIAEDYSFEYQNSNLNFAVDVVRFVETDRTRQKRLNQYNFLDTVFPPNSFSIGGKHQYTASMWKKPAALAKTVVFGKYIDPNDIRLGTLSSPHFISTLSSLCEVQANIKRLIQDQSFNNNGFYLIRLFINSVWRYIPVDSSLPFIQNENIGVLSNADAQFELSTALIEKAYAKSFSGYDVFSKIVPRQYYLRDLTGAPVTKYSPDNHQLGSIIKEAIAAGKVILAVPNDKISPLGINPNYSYIVTAFSSKGNLELRNSWGTFEEKAKINLKSDGIFQLTTAQVKDVIGHILIAHLNPTYITTTIQTGHKLGFYSTFNFEIKKDFHGYLTVSQWDQRLFPSTSGYQYSPFHLILHKVESKEQSTLVNAAFSVSSRNLDLQVNLNPGHYVVFCAANWVNLQQCYNLTFYGSEKVEFERVYTDNIPNLINQSLERINLKEGQKTSMNKSIAQYFLYHQSSNLIILTVENFSEAISTATVDLSKVKMRHMALLTSHNKEDNYSNKIDIEIDEYKGTPLTERKWSVRLEPHQTYTWILAVDEVYNVQNLKNWGFN